MSIEGLCQCGCGRRTPLAKRTRPHLRHVRGEPLSFCAGHGTRSAPERWEERDCGHATLCWVWLGAIAHTTGYAQIQIGPKGERKRAGAHRVFYERQHGPIPDGMDLDHLCRNRACVNPLHLEAVPRALNVQRGHAAKLTAEQVEQIRASELSQPRLAALFGVTAHQIWMIRAGRSWSLAT